MHTCGNLSKAICIAEARETSKTVHERAGAVLLHCSHLRGLLTRRLLCLRVALELVFCMHLRLLSLRREATQVPQRVRALPAGNRNACNLTARALGIDHPVQAYDTKHSGLTRRACASLDHSRSRRNARKHTFLRLYPRATPNPHARRLGMCSGYAWTYLLAADLCGL
jgi:hypothetical protein